MKGKFLSIADFIVPNTGTQTAFALATASGAERVIIGINEQGRLTATLYQETVTGPKLESGSRHSLLVRVHSHHEKPDELSVQLGPPGEISTEPENWTLNNRQGSSNANLSRVTLRSKTAGFGNVRVAPNRESLAKTEIVEGTEASQKNDAHGHTFEKRSKSVC